MEAKIITQDGAVKLSVNGEIIQPLGYMTYNVNAGRIKRMNELDEKRKRYNEVVEMGAYTSKQRIIISKEISIYNE